jgi:anti-anti-sigma factor
MPEAAARILTIELTHSAPDVVVVLCHGRLVWGTNDLLYTTVRPLLPANKRVILDLSDLNHTDSMGLGTLVRLYVASKSEGCSLELINLSKQIRYLLGLTHLFDVFTVIAENGVKFM